MFNFQLKIDDKSVSIDEVRHGSEWSSVFVNGFSSCHKIPSYIAANNSTYKNITFKTGGHKYQVTR